MLKHYFPLSTSPLLSIECSSREVIVCKLFGHSKIKWEFEKCRSCFNTQNVTYAKLANRYWIGTETFILKLNQIRRAQYYSNQMRKWVFFCFCRCCRSFLKKGTLLYSIHTHIYTTAPPNRQNVINVHKFSIFLFLKENWDTFLPFHPALLGLLWKLPS